MRALRTHVAWCVASSAIGAGAALGGCGDSVTGTKHVSPPLAATGAIDAAAPSPPTGSAPPSPSTGSEAGPPASASGSADAAPPPFACAGKTGVAGDFTLTLTSGGLARDSLLHVPASYDPAKGTMLVVNYHGFSSNAAEQLALTAMNSVADADGFVVAYPDGIGSGWNAGDCCTELQTTKVDDVQFTRDLLARIESGYCIEPRRVYATGFSNGGFLSHLLACELADTFAAVAPVSGVLGVPLPTCLPARPVPVLDIHGTADPVVPYDGGPALKLLPPIVFLSVDATVSFWRSADACLGAPEITYAEGDATCVRWGDCDGGADVEQCVLVGDGHQWPDGTVAVPGLGNMSTSLPATQYIADWFIAHPMPPTAGGP